MSLKCKMAFIKKVPAGASISYGRTYITPQTTSIAILPIGYADGYPYSLSNKAEVLIRGRRAPILGRVCMDQTIVDVGHIRGVKVGDEVVLWGNQEKERISVQEVSSWANTIPYELLTRIGRSVQRVYRDSD
jgi:alanine racemase